MKEAEDYDKEKIAVEEENVKVKGEEKKEEDMQSKNYNADSAADKVIEKVTQEYANKDNQRIKKDLKVHCIVIEKDFYAEIVQM